VIVIRLLGHYLNTLVATTNFIEDLVSYVAGLICSCCLDQVPKFHVALTGTDFIRMDSSATFLMIAAECGNCVLRSSRNNADS
jgi:hypothetical protein